MRKQSPKQKAVWRHNAFIGSACMMQKQAQAIVDSTTASDQAKAAAKAIWSMARSLETALRSGRADAQS